MNLLFLFPLFFLAAAFSFYVPGALVLSYVFPTLSKERRFIASWAVGISFFILLAYCFAWFHMDFLLLFALVAVNIFALLKQRTIFSLPKKIDLVPILLILVGSICFLGITFFSGFQTSKGVQFIGIINIADGLLHITNIKQLLIHFPPNHASLSGIPLRGYHYFYDLLLSRFVLFYHFNPFDLYYRFFSLFISLLYGGAFYLCVDKLKFNTWQKVSVLFFAYFAQSSGPFLHLFMPSVLPQAELGLVYPIELITNPAIILSISLLLISSFILLEIKSIKQAIVAGILFGSITEIKFYTGFVGIIVLCLYCLYEVLYKRKSLKSYTVAIVTTAILTAVTFLPNNLGTGSLWFSPFVYSVFMQEPPVSIWQWELRRRIFAMHNNILHLGVLYAQAIGVFWLFALGSRMIVLLGIFKLFSKEFWKKDGNIVFLIAIVFPIVIASLFVQSVSIFDTKQFMWIAACFMVIPTGAVLGAILSKVPKLLKLGIIILLVVFSIQTMVFLENDFLINGAKYVVTQDQINFFTKIHEKVNSNSFIFAVVDSYKLYTGDVARGLGTTPMISAFTGRSVYLEFEPAQYNLDLEYAKRKKVIADMTTAISSCSEEKIRNITSALNTKYLLTFPVDNCLPKTSLVKEQIKTSDMAFYILK